jgi:phosphoribosylanthranilate isomerase
MIMSDPQNVIDFIPRIKICGMKDMNSVQLAVRHGADCVGFITEVPVNTHRRIDRETARELAASTPPLINTVMVCMPKDVNNAIELITFVRPDAVQVHSPMSLEDLRSIKENTHTRIIKTIHVNEDTDVSSILHYISKISVVVDAILLDSNVGGRSGGTGVTHDWTKSKGITAHSPLPVILAGGLHPGNVAEAVRTVAPYGVDTASGAETDQKKDEEKIRLFIRHARGQ